MTITPLKVKFGNLLRDYLQRAGVRQNKLAEELNVSGSAVSQMLSGRIVLNQPQLKQVCELLSLDEMQSYELISMLASIRNGVENLTSPFNRQLFALRCQRGLTVRQLSNLSGVPVSHIEVLEKCFDAIPAADEVEKLARILDFPSSSLLRAAGLHSDAATTTASDGAVAAAEVAVSPYKKGSNHVPVVRLSELAEYDNSGDWYEFMCRVSCHTTTVNSDFAGVDDLVVLLAPAMKLGLGLPGEATVTLARKRPAGLKEIMFCRGADQHFFFTEKLGRDTFRILRTVGTRRPSDEIIWQIPVLELTLRPVSGKAKVK
ncbi:MAG: helix-turn-helix transcriptional regulator [Victivallaceae bacterium]|nr:helix-turn-helix transcriptional regulator [Victivallaceae bacterium]